MRGLGYTHGHEAVGRFIQEKLTPIVIGKDPFAIPARWLDVVMAIRNEGNCGMVHMAISVVDNALWDVKTKLLDLPLCAEAYARVIRSDVPIVVQHTRLDSRQAENALMTTIAYTE